MSRENLSSEIYDPIRLKPVYSATEGSKSLKRLDIETSWTATNKGADQTARIHRLICAFVVCIWNKQVLSWRASIVFLLLFFF